uniref:Homeobox_KN domain-containing protein n=1 Tax=Macrostomum lignano TaxID=282301 RepID=A0A1I8FN86_9PLAT
MALVRLELIGTAGSRIFRVNAQPVPLAAVRPTRSTSSPITEGALISSAIPAAWRLSDLELQRIPVLQLQSFLPLLWLLAVRPMEPAEGRPCKPAAELKDWLLGGAEEPCCCPAEAEGRRQAEKRGFRGTLRFARQLMEAQPSYNKAAVIISTAQLLTTMKCPVPKARPAAAPGARSRPVEPAEGVRLQVLPWRRPKRRRCRLSDQQWADDEEALLLSLLRPQRAAAQAEKRGFRNSPEVRKATME